MEHLRETWRDLSKTASGRRTLYRGISLQGASARYAWGLDKEIVGKFSRAMKKGDHDTAAKVVLDLCEQSGEFVEGGHFGVWWSTDLKVARGYAGMHTRETLGCVIYAEIDDEDVNPGHAEQYGYTHESPVVLREGAKIDIVAIEVRYNPDLKVLRDGDFVKIPVRRTVTASLVRKTAGMIPATTSTNGPFRTVVDVEPTDRRVRGVTPHQSSVTTWRERVDALPESYTPAIMSAVENVYDQGYNEDDDEFWERVYGEVMA